MTLTSFEKARYLINYWVHEEDAAIDGLLDKNTQIVKGLIIPFDKELNINLLSKESTQGKRDLLKWYLFELFDLFGFFREYDYLIRNCTISGFGANVMYKSANDKEFRELERFEAYVVNCYEVFDLMMNTFLLCFIKYNIDFYAVANEINYPLEYVDCGMLEGFMQSKNNEQSTPTAETQIPTPFRNNFDHVPSQEVYNYFKENLVDANHLDLETFRQYLKSAFEDMQIPQNRYSIKGVKSQKLVTKIFYNYYSEIASKPHGQKRKYVALLGDYFRGYDTDKLMSNFSKSTY